VTGRLRFREWETEAGDKRNGYEMIVGELGRSLRGTARRKADNTPTRRNPLSLPDRRTTSRPSSPTSMNEEAPYPVRRPFPIPSRSSFFRDTPRNCMQRSCRCAMISPMAGKAGRRKRSQGTGGTVPLQSRVPPHVKERYEQLANSRAISLSMLFEELIDLHYPRPAGHATDLYEENALELTP
jgi:hypothetical protein